MKDPGLEPRPGEPTPGGDIGKKGGDAPPPERPIDDEPTGLPGRKPEPKQPTI
jgi:hypothetical protein